MDKNIEINSSKWGNLGFQNHLNAINMAEKIDSWCVKVTTENREKIKSWFTPLYKNCTKDFSIGAYYGYQKDGTLEACFSSKNNYNKEISTEEFYKKLV